MAKERLSREERGRQLRDLFNNLRAQGVALWPAEFCRLAGIAKTTLHKYPELYQKISAYGQQTAPHMMRGKATVTGTAARKRGIDENVRREHERWSREIPKFRTRLKESEEAIAERDRRIEALEERTNRLERCLEALIARAKAAGVSPRQIQKIVNAMAEAPDGEGDGKIAGTIRRREGDSDGRGDDQEG